MTATRVDLRWRPTAHAHRLLAVGVVSLGAGVVLGRPVLAAAAAPFLVLLAWGLSVARPAVVEVRGALLADRCVEGEQVDARVVVELDVPVDQVDVSVPFSGDPRPPQTQRLRGESPLAHTAALETQRWGRWSAGPATVRLTAGGGVIASTVSVPLGELAVYPHATAERAVLSVGRLPDRSGDHASRMLGEGVEFAGIAEHVAGLPQRRVNWSVTTRRGQLHVNRFAAERALDLVLAIDAFSDVGERGSSSLDVSLRGVVGLAQAYLRRHDRVGVVAIGGVLRWLGPDVGTRQLYRVAEQLLAVRLDASFVDPDLERIPRSALPPGALVILFTPLLDPRAAEAARELRERGHPVVVVDLLTVEPVPGPRNRLGGPALRLWRLDRIALHRELAAAGIAVVLWDGHAPLDAILAPLARVPLAARSS